MDEYSEILEHIRKFAEKTVIVEGKRDKIALEKLGFSDVRPLHGTIFKFCEDLDCEEVMILTDFDKEGKKLYSMIKENLEMNRIRVEDTLREYLQRTKLTHIEGLDTYLENLKSQ